MAPIMLGMLKARRAYLLGTADLINFRMWTALTRTVTRGLPQDDIPPSPQSVADFLAENRFRNAEDEIHDSGFTPLIFASISGNVVVVRELITNFRVNIRARVLVNLPRFGTEKGMDALTFAVCDCPPEEAREIVSLLLAEGADPNLTFPSGGTPLIAAVVRHNVDGIRTLISSAARFGEGKLDLEKGMKVNRATALLVAGAFGTFEVIEALLEAGAKRDAKNDAGGNLLNAICCNPAATPRWLELICGSSASPEHMAFDINHQTSPRNSKWKLIGKAMRTLCRLNISHSDLVMDLAHVECATPIHLAARQGNFKIVEWLLMNGAEKSLRLKNRMGYTPIDIAREFGPYHEVCGLLGASMCADLAESQQPPSMRQSSDLALRVARSGQTAIAMQ